MSPNNEFAELEAVRPQLAGAFDEIVTAKPDQTEKARFIAEHGSDAYFSRAEQQRAEQEKRAAALAADLVRIGPAEGSNTSPSAPA